MKKISLIIFSIVGIIFIVSEMIPFIVFPADLLVNLPSFSSDGWSRPKNSLLADPVFQFEPWRVYSKLRITQGEFPLWNDSNGNGAPFFANPQTAILYPLTIVYYLLPVKIALNVIFLLKIFFFGLFTYWYFRSISLSKSVSFLGSLIAPFFGFFIVWNQWPHTNVFLLFPLLLYCTEKIKRANKFRYRWYVLTSFVYGFAVFGGHPETLFQITIIHTAYVLWSLWEEKKKMFGIIVSIGGGFLLGAFQLIPFLEYLTRSVALEHRTLVSQNSSLPLFAFVFNFIPFLLGSPHLAIYRPLDQSTNFQEMIGGYVGVGVLLFALFGMWYGRKNRIVRFWGSLTIFSWMLVYLFSQIGMFSLIPLINISANHRLVGFAGFGLITVFVISLQMVLDKKIVIPLVARNIGYTILLFILLLSLLFIFSFEPQILFVQQKLQHFMLFLKWHIVWIILSTAVFFFAFFLYIQKVFSKQIMLTLMGLTILCQTLFLFWNYNPFVSKSFYYPQTQLTKFLQQLPAGTILEVGNPTIPPSINLVYNLKHVRNDDALEVLSYRKEFDLLFPEKNNWGIVDDISLSGLKKIGVKYVISDYDLNLKKETVQSKKETIRPLLSGQKIKIPFSPSSNLLKQVRFVTANFNRRNTCHISVEVYQSDGDLLKGRRELACLDVRDFMYFTVSFPEIQIEKEKQYFVVFSTTDSTPDNGIGLWSDIERIPYLEVLYDEDRHDYQMLYEEKNILVWQIPSTGLLDIPNGYKLVVDTPEQKSFEVNLESGKDIVFKQTYFPGWQASVDGHETRVVNSTPFQKVFVPPGKHLLTFSYKPLSVLLGFCVSLTTLFFLSFYFLNNELRQSWILLLRERWWRVVKIGNSIPWWQHITVVFCAALVGLGLSIFLFSHLQIPSQQQTTAINWMSVNNYPVQQVYIAVIGGFVFAFLFTVGVWMLWLWKKIK